MALKPKTRIAHLAGPTATIQNTPPLVTSNKARLKYGLPPRKNPDGTVPVFDGLRAQRLAAPAKVYVEQFSAHPLEADTVELYGPPDGYIGADGTFRKTRATEGDKAVYEIELHPDDGLYPMPYMAIQADGNPWDEECTSPGAPIEKARQGFFPTDRAASRRSTAFRSASTAWRARFPRWRPSTSIAARRRAASPRACPRTCARTRAKATSRRKSAARISIPISPITSRPPRRGRCSPR